MPAIAGRDNLLTPGEEEWPRKGARTIIHHYPVPVGPWAEPRAGESLWPQADRGEGNNAPGLL